MWEPVVGRVPALFTDSLRRVLHGQADGKRTGSRLTIRGGPVIGIGYVLFGIAAAVAAGLLFYWTAKRTARRPSRGGRRW
jgi:hypothetical protein